MRVDTNAGTWVDGEVTVFRSVLWSWTYESWSELLNPTPWTSINAVFHSPYRFNAY
jgi:hypothetical protein